jgi:hypothetical protein
MIADLSSARFSSAREAAFSSSDGVEADGGAEKRPTYQVDPQGDFRPIRWLLPWLWQLSQTPVEQGEPIEWEVDLPEGDRLRLKAVQNAGEWSLNFSGSSLRLLQSA